MAYITTQNRIASQIDALVSNVEGLSFVQHFDYPESICYVGNATVVQSGQKFGKGCAFFPDSNSHVIITNNTGLFNMHSLGNYELEAFVKFSEIDYEAQGYKFFGGHTFKYFDTGLTWAEAKAACEALGGHLATSTSSEKNSFLASMVSADWASIGGQKVDDAWTWLTNETWNYLNWRSNSPSAGENETSLFMNTSGEWDDDETSFNAAYICEWDSVKLTDESKPVAVTEPAPLTHEKTVINSEFEGRIMLAQWGYGFTPTEDSPLFGNTPSGGE